MPQEPRDRFRTGGGSTKLILIIGCCFTTYCNRHLLDLACHGDDSDDLEFVFSRAGPIEHAHLERAKGGDRRLEVEPLENGRPASVRGIAQVGVDHLIVARAPSYAADHDSHRTSHAAADSFWSACH